MARRRRWAVTTVAVMLVSGASTPPVHAGGDALFRKLYREDVLVDLEFREGVCDLQRSGVQVAFHQDFFLDAPAPTRRSVLFGVGISEFDCTGAFVRYEGSDATPRRFDVTPGLDRATVRATMTACEVSPAAGACFPVHITAFVQGVGPITVERDANRVHEPDCIIEQVFVTKTRAAKVWGSVSYTLPDGTARRHRMSPAALTAVGATVSSGSERTFMRGDGVECTER